MNKKVGRCIIYIYLFYLGGLYDRNLKELIKSKINYYNLIDYYICGYVDTWNYCPPRVHYDLYHSYFILFRHTSTEDC